MACTTVAVVILQRVSLQDTVRLQETKLANALVPAQLGCGGIPLVDTLLAEYIADRFGSQTQVRA